MICLEGNILLNLFKLFEICYIFFNPQVVITWLERGDCNKKNVNNFYSMIQSTNSHVRRLMHEKSQYEDELKKAKDIMKVRMQGILLQCKYFI